MTKPRISQALQNKYGQVRSGWIILFAMAALYAALFATQKITSALLTSYLTATGNIDPATGHFSELVNWLDAVALPIYYQVAMEICMTSIPVILWKFMMKQRLHGLGLRPIRLKQGGLGVLLGAVNCSVVLLIILAAGGGQIVAGSPRFSGLTLTWIFVFALIAIGEETMYRGLFMGALRRTRCLPCILLLPSFIFGLIHLINPGATILSVVNIIAVGLLFSYMYIKSGNLSMCIGYHFAWNTFQGIVYGMPVSGLAAPSILTTRFTRNDLLNGGNFGIEGGILTTLITLLGFLFVWLYYRKSKYDFIQDNFDGGR